MNWRLRATHGVQLRHLDWLWRAGGVIVPVVGALIVVEVIGPMTQLGLGGRAVVIVAAFLAGLVSALMLRSWSAIVIVPVVYELALWLLRRQSCAACAGPSADGDALRELGYALVGLSPIILGTLAGLLERRSADRTS